MLFGGGGCGIGLGGLRGTSLRIPACSGFLGAGAEGGPVVGASVGTGAMPPTGAPDEAGLSAFETAGPVAGLFAFEADGAGTERFAGEGISPGPRKLSDTPPLSPADGVGATCGA